jgi:hypothetical protein
MDDGAGANVRVGRALSAEVVAGDGGQRCPWQQPRSNCVSEPVGSESLRVLGRYAVDRLAAARYLVAVVGRDVVVSRAAVDDVALSV